MIKSSTTKEEGFEEKAMSTLDWKKRVHDLLQSKASKISSSQKEKLQSITSVDDLKQAEKMVMEMEEEERCIEEYERQMNNSSKKAAIEDFGHSAHNKQNNLHLSNNNKKGDYASSVKDEDQEEIEASTQRSFFPRKQKELDFSSNKNSKHGTQRQTGQSWLGNVQNKKVDEEQDEDVIELETGNWEDLKWGLVQNGIIEDNNSKRHEHEKRSQNILHKLEELLDGWTQDSEKENSARNKY